MILLEEVLVSGGVSFRVDEGIRVRVTGRRSARAALPYLLSCWALKSARHLAISAARCSAKRYLSSGVTLVSPVGCRKKGLPSLKGRMVTGFCHPARSCARGAQSVKDAGRSKWARFAL